MRTVNVDLSLTPEITLQLAGFTSLVLFIFVSLSELEGEYRRVDRGEREEMSLYSHLSGRRQGAEPIGRAELELGKVEGGRNEEEEGMFSEMLARPKCKFSTTRQTNK